MTIITGIALKSVPRAKVVENVNIVASGIGTQTMVMKHQRDSGIAVSVV